jgi:DNA end-binding protein Ku
VPTASWTGTIGFGLVNVPVRLYPATRKKDVRFHELDRLTGQRVRHQRVRTSEPVEPPRWQAGAPSEPALEPGGLIDRQLAAMVKHPARVTPPSAPPREVQAEDVQKGFEIARDQYVTASPEELAALAPEPSRTIEIVQFVDASAVDPIYFDSSYYAVPERDAVRSFALLRDGMEKTGAVAISWFMLRRKRRLAAVRPFGSVMLVTSMLHADEILPAPTLGAEPEDLTRKERDLAALLINTLRGPFEPERYPDEYREKLLAMLQGRAGSAVKTTREPTGSGAVPDLMAALKASLDQAKKARPKPVARPAARRRRKSA